MSSRRTTSQIFEMEDVEEWLEIAYERGWTDGLPVAPPTEDRVLALVERVKRKPEERLGLIPPLGGEATVEKVAIQAVMAGCRPEHFPVVLAALECMLCEDDDLHFNLKGVQDTTHCVTPLVIVSGPAVRDMGFHYRENAFGGFSRANGSVGRAVRLILWNLGGARPGATDMTHLGHPGKYSYCIAENPDPSENLWTPLNAEWGCPAHQSTVTVFGCEAPRTILALSYVGSDGHRPLSPEATLRLMARSMATPGSNNARNMGGEILVTFGPRCVELLNQAGYSKEAARDFLYEQARVKVADLIGDGFIDPALDYSPWFDRNRPETMVPIVDRKEGIHIVVTGGTRLPWNSICHGWGVSGGYAVTRPIQA